MSDLLRRIRDDQGPVYGYFFVMGGAAGAVVGVVLGLVIERLWGWI